MCPGAARLGLQDLGCKTILQTLQGLQPHAPSLQPRAPSLQPSAPSLQPHAPSLQPSAPSMQPRAPSLQPRAPSLQPRAPCLQPPALQVGDLNPMRRQRFVYSSRCHRRVTTHYSPLTAHYSLLTTYYTHSGTPPASAARTLPWPDAAASRWSRPPPTLQLYVLMPATLCEGTCNPMC